MADDFRDWLKSEIERRGLSYSEIGRRGDITHARISQVLSGEPPGKVFCIGIANAFGLEANEVLRLAGHPVPELDTSTLNGNSKDLLGIYHQLSEDGKAAVYRFARWQLEQEES